MSNLKIGSAENTFGNALREARKALGLTQAKFAEPLSITGSYVSDVEKGKATPSEAVVREISEKYRINRNKLETGQGDLFKKIETVGWVENKAVEIEEGLSARDYDKIRQAIIYHDLPAVAPLGYVTVPRYEVSASAGAGALVHSEQIVDHLAFKADWLKVSLGLSPNNVAVISVIGDSMEPYLAEGDLIMVDLGIHSVENNAVYVLQFGDSLLVKRVQVKLDGEVIVKSDNPRYETESFRGASAEQLRVVGRMVRRLVR
jgi:transcriptional regulator with XRE-family HTH domain